MKNFKILSTIKFLFTLALLVSITAACSNSTSSKEEIHPEAVGFILRLNGDTIVEKYPDQDLINNFPTLTAGDETAGITISFLDEDGNEFTPDEPEVFLDFKVSDTNVIQIEQHDGELWEFHVVALAEGSSNLTLSLMHDNHPDYTGTPIEITVNAAAQ